MVRPPAKHQGAPSDVDLVCFINDFLFNHHHNDSPLRTTPRCKRYRSMWRAAAASLIEKRRSASQETHTLSEDPLLKSLPSNVFSDTLTNKEVSCLSLYSGGDIATSNSQEHEHLQTNDVTIDLDAALPSATTRGFHKDQTRQSSTHVVPKRSSRKPPRPPKVGVLRSGSYRAIRLKTSSRRALVDNARSKKNNMQESSSNATFICALIITICFVSLMLFQVFSGNDSKSAVEVQGLGEGAFHVKVRRLVAKYGGSFYSDINVV